MANEPMGRPLRMAPSRNVSSRSWEESVLALFADLELTAEGLQLAERSDEVAALGIAEYAGVTLGSRLLGSVGHRLGVRLAGGLVLRGELARAAADWGLLDDDQGRSWVFLLDAVTELEDLAERSVPEEARTVLARLRLGSALRGLAEERSECVWHLRDGRRLEGRPARVGHDFVEVLTPSGRAQAVPFAALAAVQERP